MTQSHPQTVDIFVIGGGINGCGIARDAAGRGLSVVLAEQGDLAQATSSASTKLFHGGLRYLEFFELRLVRKALSEREILLRAMPHISWPMRFVLPYHRDMRFEGGTPTSRLLSIIMPWTRGRRPAWLIRLGLFLYDHLGGSSILPGTRSLNLAQDTAGAALQPKYKKAFEYSDCWVQDARLVILTARDAQARGAQILTRTRVTHATRDGDLWRITLHDLHSDQTRVIHARALINAAGPWVADILQTVAHIPSRETVRLVRGSHIVTKQLFDHDKCYFFQGGDGRIIFAIPYEQDFTLIGTTDADHPDTDTAPECTPEERSYLCQFASQYFRQPITQADIVWTYSGVRPLYDDGASSATAATREYVLSMDHSGPAPMLNVFGGKITTYRRLAEEAMLHLAPTFPDATGPWTAGAPLPGGDFPVNGVQALIDTLTAAYPFLSRKTATRMIRAYGTQAQQMLGDATSASDLGQAFGADLYEREVRWLITHEYARSGDDILWRRSKLGLHLSMDQQAALHQWVTDFCAHA